MSEETSKTEFTKKAKAKAQAETETHTPWHPDCEAHLVGHADCKCPKCEEARRNP